MIGDRLTALLVLLAACLGALAAWQWQELAVVSTPLPLAVPASPPQIKSDAPTPLVVPPLAELSQTLERPLFSSNRRPPPPEVVSSVQTPQAAPSAPSGPLSVELSAVIMEDARKFALFRQNTQGALLRAALGESVDGWKVSEIRPDGVSLERGTERQELVLRTFKAPVIKPPARKAPARRVPARTPNAAQGRRPAAKASAPRARVQRRPRRPLRGPRRRSIQRQSSQAAQQ